MKCILAVTGSIANDVKNWKDEEVKKFNNEGKWTYYISDNTLINRNLLVHGNIDINKYDKLILVEIEKNKEVKLIADDIPGWSVASKGNLTVALDITITEDLKQEGDARELVNRIQNIRKENGFELTDRIFVKLLESDGFKQSIIKFNDYICREILADNIEWVSTLPDGVEIEINETLLKLAVTKKG